MKILNDEMLAVVMGGNGAAMVTGIAGAIYNYWDDFVEGFKQGAHRESIQYGDGMSGPNA